MLYSYVFHGADYSAIVGGQTNEITTNTHNFIGGGIGNTVSGHYSSILGGSGNRVSGTFSSISGGTGNNDGGLTNVHIAGSGITAVNPGSLHVNGLWANGIPVFPAGFPYNAGTVFVVPIGTTPPAAASGALYIM